MPKHVMATQRLHFQIYPFRNKWFQKRWDWRLVSGNGEILCGSRQGYVNRVDAMMAIGLTVSANVDTPIIETE